MKARKSKKGQTMVEYIIIVALIAISLIAVFMYFGRATGKKVAGAAAAISEEEGGKAKSAVEDIDEHTSKKLGECRRRRRISAPTPARDPVGGRDRRWSRRSSSCSSFVSPSSACTNTRTSSPRTRW